MTTTSGRVKDHVHYIARSANDKSVYADLMLMPLAGNISRNPHLLRLTEEVLETLELSGASMQLEHNMDRTVGYGEITETTDNDVIFYAQQTKGADFTRFVKNGKAELTQSITIALSCDEDGDYELTNVWIGRPYPAIPGHVDATADSKEYWANHAVLYNGQSVIGGTITKECPY